MNTLIKIAAKRKTAPMSKIELKKIKPSIFERKPTFIDSYPRTLKDYKRKKRIHHLSSPLNKNKYRQ